MQTSRIPTGQNLFLLLLLLFSSQVWAADSDPSPVATRVNIPLPSAPTPPKILTRSAGVESAPRARVKLQSVPPGLSLYSIGTPTDEEQLYLEFINRARLDPPAEGLRFQSTTDLDILEDYEFFGVDLARLVSQFALIAAAPPLSLNSNLTAAARLHSRDMLSNEFQGHNGTDGSTLDGRITAQNYDWTTIGENVFSHARSVWHGHAGFNVDWGGNASTGGMQEPPGHRNSIHNPSFREIGIGVVNGTNGTVGPQLVTQDFASRRSPSPFVTGVAYYDLNGNGFYDIGEGIGGVTVVASGSQFYAVTASSGGYSVPVTGNGSHTVTFRMSGVPEVQTTAVVVNNSNVKVDLTPAYTAPGITGSDQPSVGRDNLYTYSAVGGANAYQWKRNRRIPFTETIGAEAGLAGFTAITSSGYDVVTSSVKASGANSYHLAHPPQKEDQFLTIDRVFRVGQSAQLAFASRLGWATSDQVARVQISTSGGETWQDVWSQAGTGDRGETAFKQQTVSLGNFAGQEIMVRFMYDYLGGNFFPQTDAGVGFYIDNITLAGAEELVGEITTDIPSGTSFAFRPAEIGDYSLRVRAKVSDRFFPWGPAKLVSSRIGGVLEPTVNISAIRTVSAGRFLIDFNVTNPGSGIYELQSAASVAGPWATDSSASITSLGSPSSFRVSLDAGPGGQGFYRVLAR